VDKCGVLYIIELIVVVVIVTPPSLIYCQRGKWLMGIF
jgi:hypothetical protein